MKKYPLLWLVPLLALVPVSMFAVERTLVIKAPASVPAHSGVHVEVTATTNAGDAEQIGFFQAEYSVDGGKNWVPVYAEKLGASAKRGVDFTAGAAGVPALVRVRIAFRGGKAGDVDFTGKPIAWGGSWGTWENPPAKQVSIPVKAP